MDIESGKKTRRFEGHIAGLPEIALSADGKKSCRRSYDNRVTGKEIRQREALAKIVHALEFSRDGRRISSADYDGHTVSLWDVETGRQFNRLEGTRTTSWTLPFQPMGVSLFPGGGTKRFQCGLCPGSLELSTRA